MASALAVLVTWLVGGSFICGVAYELNERDIISDDIATGVVAVCTWPLFLIGFLGVLLVRRSQRVKDVAAMLRKAAS